ncbi:sensor histidine kinase [Chengkuizengella axinellae]|uniref:histidine kinase n=1 Tax=Chengkuizengella axinellae TaxID=3064388 RepID=A0ABT9J037_9BACL|nr:sensor histidine kinase [Chengkuizengella sp. 2205SS18-9]MDP5274757.1 ATP-binding protein [Chengkuizengella sp. 2205SS18-9]
MQLKIKLSLIFSAIVVSILLLSTTFNYFSSKEVLHEDREQDMESVAQRIAQFLQYDDQTFYIDAPAHFVEKMFSNNENILEISGFEPQSHQENPILIIDTELDHHCDHPTINDFNQYARLDYHEELDIEYIEQVLESNQTISVISTHQKEKVMKVFVPITSESPYVISIVLDYTSIQNVLDQQLLYNFTILFLAICVAVIVSFFFARYIVEPLQQILLKLNDIHNGKYGVQVDVIRKDELGLLGERVNALSLNLKKYKQSEEMLIKSEKLAVVGQLSAGVVHEIRNPLTSLIGFLNLIRHGKEMNKEVLDVMTSELHRIELILSELLILAKPQEISYKKINIHKLLKDVLTLIDIQATQNNVKIHMQVEEKIPHIDCDENQLKQVFINLLKNAIEAMSFGGNINIVVKMMEDEKVIISIQDDGCGMDEEEVCKLGEPFFSRKEKGTGLGFMLSEKMIHNHKGSIQIKSVKNEGTQVNVILPLTQDQHI